MLASSISFVLRALENMDALGLHVVAETLVVR